MYFQNRAEAGRLLSKLLKKYANQDVVVYALPRGGVVTGLEVAKFLHSPLDLIITRKIGHPYQSEYAIAAIAEDGHLIGKQNELDSVDQQWLKQEIANQRKEAQRRRETYLAGQSSIPVEGKTAILVDDGVATGLTMRVAIKELRHRKPAKIVVAVPIVPERTAKVLMEEADELVALDIPRERNFLGAIGSYYENFFPVEDDEVISIMRSYKSVSGAPTVQQSENVRVHADPILFAFPAYTYISKPLSSLPDVVKGRFQARRFPNGELHLDLASFRPEEDCVIIGTIAPPEKNLFSILLLAHTLKKERARKVIAMLPYLSYSRQDRSEPGRSLATPLIGRLLKTAGVDEVLTVDVHSLESLALFPIPLRSLSPATIFADEIIRLGMDDATILAPDEGALPRVKDVAARIGPEAHVASMRKKRVSGGVIHSEISENIGKRVVIIDDILDTGGTLISCCKALCSRGVDEIVIMVTHGLFTGPEWKELWDLNVKFIYCTDTLPPESHPVSKNIRVLSIIPLLTEEIQKTESTKFLTAEEEEEEAYDYDLSPW